MQRVAFTMRVKEGQENEYIRRHREVWPEQLVALQQAGIHKMSIFMKGTELFVFMEVEDYAQAVRVLAENPDSIRWEQYMTQILKNTAGGSDDSHAPYPNSLTEVFFWQPN